MVSPELLRRYPFFAGLSHDHIVSLAKISEEVSIEEGEYIFREEEELENFFIALDGAVAIVFELPERDVQHKIAEQFLRDLKTRDVIVSTIGSGDVFGWSGLVPPYKATAGAKALTKCKVIAIKGKELREIFEKDLKFGYLMTQRAAQVIRDRLRDIRIESLASYTA